MTFGNQKTDCGGEMTKKEREIIKADSVALMKIKRILGIKQKNCYYCKIKITGKNIGGILSHPTRLICKSLVCVFGAVES